MATISLGDRRLKQLPLNTATFEAGSYLKMYNDDADNSAISYADFITALIAGGSIAPTWTDVTVTDADFTAADNTRYYLAAGVLTTNRVVDVSGITSKVAFIVAEDAFRLRLTFTGATAYDYGGGETTDGVEGRASSVYEIIDSKLIRTQ